MIAEKKISKNTTNLFISERKLNISIAFTTQFYLKVPKDKVEQFTIIYAIIPNKHRLIIESFLRY